MWWCRRVRRRGSRAPRARRSHHSLPKPTTQKPFEHLVKEQQREERAKREKEQLQNVVNYQWVRLAAVDCRSTRSPVPSPPLPRVLQVPNKVSD